MTPETVTLFFALLAVALQALLVAGVLASRSASIRSHIVATIGPIAAPFATTIAVVAMLGSLYLSEVAHYLPCKLCWYQRIAMYSSAIVLVTATIRREAVIRPYVTTLCSIGAVISIYHALIERFPQLESSTCDPTNPCSLKWVERFGYLTIPVMALTAFVSIIALLAIAGAHDRDINSPTIGES